MTSDSVLDIWNKFYSSWPATRQLWMVFSITILSSKITFIAFNLSAFSLTLHMKRYLCFQLLCFANLFVRKLNAKCLIRRCFDCKIGPLSVLSLTWYHPIFNPTLSWLTISFKDSHLKVFSNLKTELGTYLMPRDKVKVLADGKSTKIIFLKNLLTVDLSYP